MHGHGKDGSILVVGGAGYIGSQMAKTLERRGYSPVILDDLSTGHRGAAQSLPFYEVKASDDALVTRIIDQHQVSAVMHFSAKALVSESVKDPLLYYAANVAETVALLKTMERTTVRTLVFSSTCAVYGEPDGPLLNENSPKRPVNPYGQSKLMVEQILEDCARRLGFSVAVLRYFNAAGADGEGELGERHDPETHLIPLVLKAALGTRPKLTVYGSDYPTIDGTCVRDYVHVEDLAEGHIKALELIRARGGLHDFNLGSGKGYSNLEVIRTAEKTTGLKIPFENGPRREGDPARLVADCSKASEVLGWSPRHNLESILRTAFDWEKKQ